MATGAIDLRSLPMTQAVAASIPAKKTHRTALRRPTETGKHRPLLRYRHGAATGTRRSLEFSKRPSVRMWLSWDVADPTIAPLLRADGVEVALAADRCAEFGRPHGFLLRIVPILRKGIIRSARDAASDKSCEPPMSSVRHQLLKTCPADMDQIGVVTPPEIDIRLLRQTVVDNDIETVRCAKRRH